MPDCSIVLCVVLCRAMPQQQGSAVSTAALQRRSGSILCALLKSSFYVQGNRGVNGTATLVNSLSRNGAQLSNVTTPLAGRPVHPN